MLSPNHPVTRCNAIDRANVRYYDSRSEVGGTAADKTPKYRLWVSKKSGYWYQNCPGFGTVC